MDCIGKRKPAWQWQWHYFCPPFACLKWSVTQDPTFCTCAQVRSNPNLPICINLPNEHQRATIGSRTLVPTCWCWEGIIRDGHSPTLWMCGYNAPTRTTQNSQMIRYHDIHERNLQKYATDCKQKITSWFGNQNVKLKPNLFCRPILGYQRGSGLPLETLFFLSLGSLGIPDKLGEILWCTRSNHEACFPLFLHSATVHLVACARR